MDGFFYPSITEMLGFSSLNKQQRHKQLYYVYIVHWYVFLKRHMNIPIQCARIYMSDNLFIKSKVSHLNKYIVNIL